MSYVFCVDISLRVKVIDIPVLLKNTFARAPYLTPLIFLAALFYLTPYLHSFNVCVSLNYLKYYGNIASFLLKLRAIDIVDVTFSSKVLFCVTALFML